MEVIGEGKAKQIFAGCRRVMADSFRYTFLLRRVPASAT